MRAFGREGSEVVDRIGSLGQLARIDSYVELQGAARGARRMRLVTGGGLEVDLHPDRALDVGAVTIFGIPVAWLSPTGIAAPGYYSSAGDAWLRTFGGGLVTTCGLDTFGPPRETEEGTTAFHGRIGAVPATLVEARVAEDSLVVEAEVRQASSLGENLLLRRRITAPIAGTSFRVDDTVTNEGTRSSPHLLLYHCNIGWPLLDDAATLAVPSTAVEPVGTAAIRAPEAWRTVTEPVDGAVEQVYVHGFEGAERVTVALENPRLGLRLELAFDAASLPRLVQWRMMGRRSYVLGLEPTNFSGASTLLAHGPVAEPPRLAPGESRSYGLDFEFQRVVPQ